MVARGAQVIVLARGVVGECLDDAATRFRVTHGHAARRRRDRGAVGDRRNVLIALPVLANRHAVARVVVFQFEAVLIIDAIAQILSLHARPVDAVVALGATVLVVAELVLGRHEQTAGNRVATVVGALVSVVARHLGAGKARTFRTGVPDSARASVVARHAVKRYLTAPHRVLACAGVAHAGIRTIFRNSLEGAGQAGQIGETLANTLSVRANRWQVGLCRVIFHVR